MTTLLRLPLAELTDADRVAWAALAREAAEPNPFFEPGYAIPLARGLGQLERAALLVVAERGRWLACLPVRDGGPWHRLPLPARATWRAHVLYALLGTPLVDRARLDEAADELVDGLTGARGAAFAALEWLVEGGPVHAAVERALARRRIAPERFERFERAFLRRRPEPTYTDATISVKHRREFARQRRRLAGALGAEPAITDRAGDPAAVEALIELERRSPLAAQGSVLAADPGHAAFFREMCAAFNQDGRLQLLALQAGDRTLALKCNVVAGGTVFMLKIAYDDEFRRFSPGIQLELEMVDRFHRRPELESMDSCADANNAMINRLWPDRRTLTTLVLPARGPRGALARQGVRGVRAIRDHLNERAR